MHPKDKDDQYVPLRDGAMYERRVRAWDEEEEKWQLGLRRDPDTRDWVPVEAEFLGMTYAECAGARPDPSEYMPRWPAPECSHWQMYEETTEGTPISPVCSSAEELARWLTDHDANAFADSTTSYQDWLSLIRQGSTYSAVVTSEGVKAGFVSRAKSLN